MSARRHLFLFALLLAAVAGCGAASAQLQVDLKMERKNFVSLEPISATVTVTNTVGKDVVLGGPGRAGWLTFEVTDNTGPVSVLRPVDAPPIMIRSGEALTRKFDLSRHFYLSNSGTYMVKAITYFPELQRFNNSRPLRITVQEPRPPRWEDTFVVPRGFSSAGKYRRYQISTFHDTEKTFLYLTIFDEETRSVLSRMPVSSVMMSREFQPLLDADKNINLLFLGSPTVWVYAKLNPDGALVQQRFYKNEGAPRLVADVDGQAMVSGGFIYDPTVKPLAKPFRKLSDRPELLPAD